MQETRRINLQLFAEPPVEPPAEPPTEPGKTDPPGGEPPKTFTQEEVNAMMAKEKNQGKLSILKELGVEDSKTAKEALAKYKEYLDSQKTEAQKLADDLKAQQDAKMSAEQKAILLERKFEAVKAGVPADKADDIVILASAKVTDEKDFSKALEEIKVSYPQLFTPQGGGTGTPAGGSGKQTSATGLGARLAEAKNFGTGKSSYFKN